MAYKIELERIDYMIKNRLDAKITFRISQENRSKLEENAKSKSLTLSDYICSCCFTKSLNTFQQQELAESLIKITDEINKIPTDIMSESLKKELDNLWHVLT